MAANSPLGPRFARENAPDSGLSDMQLINCEFVAEHDSNFCDVDGKRINVNAKKITCGQEAKRALGRIDTLILVRHSLVDASLQALKLSVCDVKEIPASTGGIEDGVVLNAAEQNTQLLQCTSGFNRFAPRFNNSWPNYFHDVH